MFCVLFIVFWHSERKFSCVQKSTLKTQERNISSTNDFSNHCWLRCAICRYLFNGRSKVPAPIFEIGAGFRISGPLSPEIFKLRPVDLCLKWAWHQRHVLTMQFTHASNINKHRAISVCEVFVAVFKYILSISQIKSLKYRTHTYEYMTACFVVLENKAI